jgi:hypothetical protein
MEVQAGNKESESAEESFRPDIRITINLSCQRSGTEMQKEMT